MYSFKRNTLWRMAVSCVVALLSFMPLSLRAQMDSILFYNDYAIDSTTVKELHLHVDNLTFLKDNEWDGDVVKGYTLPGLWLQPKVSYSPLPEIQLEAGLHALIYAGTIKYPSLMYQDLPKWKGDQYQKGTHLLPFFRANMKLGPAHVVLGNIYGGATHMLPDPLYAQELNLTADPEMGGQLLIDLPRWHFDVWINWQSFTFKGDYHAEAFCAGFTSRYSLVGKTSSMADKGYELTLPISALAQHVGGEIDTVGGISTHFNASVGIELKRHRPATWLRYWSAEAHLLGYSQNKGETWPINNGWGAYIAGHMQFNNGLGLKLGYMHNHDFQPLLGYNYYGTIAKGQADATPLTTPAPASAPTTTVHATTPAATVPATAATSAPIPTTTPAATVPAASAAALITAYRHPNLVTLQADWTKAFARSYAFGIRVEAFAYMASKSSFNTSFGLFFRATPSFRLLKKH